MEDLEIDSLEISTLKKKFMAESSDIVSILFP